VGVIEPLARKRFELDPLSLPRSEYSNMVASTRELADAQFSNPQHMKGLVDFMVGGVEAMLSKRKGSRLQRRTPGSMSASG
jgi:hypothetical protein